jgi:hypothetical protein
MRTNVVGITMSRLIEAAGDFLLAASAACPFEAQKRVRGSYFQTRVDPF